MKSTIDLAKEAGAIQLRVDAANTEHYALAGNQNLETFRALCVAEEHKRLLGVGMEPVSAQQRFRHPQKTMPDWSVWQACTPSKRPASEIDSIGYQVEYRELYTADQLAAARLQGFNKAYETLGRVAKEGVKRQHKRIAELEEENAQLREQNDAVGKACAEMEQALAQERSKREPLTIGKIVEICDGRLTTAEQVRVVRATESAHGIGEQG